MPSPFPSLLHGEVFLGDVEPSNSVTRTVRSGLGEATGLGDWELSDGTVEDNCSTLVPWIAGPAALW
ncbi:hypothetical protein, partial [Rhodopirellula baltica]|uniref:hypothetical protein n=1 Tax=Rhodopirellula baltica TaxID=265606 RepID=UPI001F490823